MNSGVRPDFLDADFRLLLTGDADLPRRALRFVFLGLFLAREVAPPFFRLVCAIEQQHFWKILFVRHVVLSIVRRATHHHYG